MTSVPPLVADDFDARFSARKRHYLYRIVDRRAPPALDRGRVWSVPARLDVDAMHFAAQSLVGKHDFTTFRSVQCQSDSPVKTLDRLDVSEHPYPGGTEYRFDVRARSFLHNQVRSFVGTLERVGAGRWSADDVENALAAAGRSACGPVAPPDGLALVHVGYPEDPFA